MKEINEKKERGIVVLPKSDGQKREEITDRKDKIFGDSPVLGIPELIYGE